MIYNDKIKNEYGANELKFGEFPIAYKASPTDQNYVDGFFIRWFSKRINSNVATEVSSEQSSFIDTSLYSTVSLNWKISGPKENKVSNGIVENEGVIKANLREIERVKRETQVDLFQTLKNPLEFWRGY